VQILDFGSEISSCFNSGFVDFVKEPKELEESEELVPVP
jgi:hypothetical protein